MKALTSHSLNLIMFDIDKRILNEQKFINMEIEPQTTFNDKNELCGVRLKWRLKGVDKTQKKVIFNFLVEHTFDAKNPHNMKIEHARVIVYKSYITVVTEFDAQMRNSIMTTIKTPVVLEEWIVERIYTAIQKPKQ